MPEGPFNSSSDYKRSCCQSCSAFALTKTVARWRFGAVSSGHVCSDDIRGSGSSADCVRGLFRDTYHTQGGNIGAGWKKFVFRLLVGLFDFVWFYFLLAVRDGKGLCFVDYWNTKLNESLIVCLIWFCFVCLFVCFWCGPLIYCGEINLYLVNWLIISFK